MIWYAQIIVLLKGSLYYVYNFFDWFSDCLILCSFHSLSDAQKKKKKIISATPVKSEKVT